MKYARLYAAAPPCKTRTKQQRSAVHQLADSHGLQVRTPATFKDKTTRADFAALQADVAVVCRLRPPPSPGGSGCARAMVASISTPPSCPAGGGPRPFIARLRRGIRNGHLHHADGAYPGYRAYSLKQIHRHRSLDTTGSLHDRLALLGGVTIV